MSDASNGCILIRLRAGALALALAFPGITVVAAPVAAAEQKAFDTPEQAVNVRLPAGTLAVALGFPAPAAAAEQKAFETPEQAVNALVGAARSGDTKALLAILGPGSKTLLSSGDKVADAQALSKFVAEYDETNQIDNDGGDRRILTVGSDDWTFPFPIVKRGTTWEFDASAGAEEILDRRIGANELDVIEVCHAYVDAQREYAAQPDGRNQN
jgi:hypothetical protein